MISCLKMFVTFVWLMPFCQIIKILLFSHFYRDTHAYILNSCIQESNIRILKSPDYFQKIVWIWMDSIVHSLVFHSQIPRSFIPRCFEFTAKTPEASWG